MQKTIIIAVNDEIRIEEFPFLPGQRLERIIGHEFFIDQNGHDLTLEQEAWLNTHPGVEGWQETEEEENDCYRGK